jgi:hypothetical protein
MRKLLLILPLLLFSLVFVSCEKEEEKEGCTDSKATNYDADAKKDNGSCVYPSSGSGSGSGTTSGKSVTVRLKVNISATAEDDYTTGEQVTVNMWGDEDKTKSFDQTKSTTLNMGSEPEAYVEFTISQNGRYKADVLHVASGTYIEKAEESITVSSATINAGTLVERTIYCE